MATANAGRLVGYNVQTAVDAKRHLIVAHEVTNINNNQTQITNITNQTKTTIKNDKLHVLTKHNYFSNEKVITYKTLNITPYIPKTLKSKSKTKKQFNKQYFV